MKLITLKCPDCGAELQVNPALSQAVCNYCGKQLLIDDEAQHVKFDFEGSRQAGIEFERGRNEAQNAGAEEALIESMRRLSDLVVQVENLEDENKGLHAQILPLKERAKRFNSFLVKMVPFVIVAILLFTSVQMLRLSNLFIVLRVLVYILDAVLTFLAFRGASFFITHERTAAELQIKETETAIENNQSEIASLRSQQDFSLIPPGYQARDAVCFIAEALANKRALTIQQAINLYEEQQHKARVEALQQEQLALQQQNLELQRQQMQELKAIKESSGKNKVVGNRESSGIGAAFLGGVAAAGGAAITDAVAQKLKDKFL